MSSRPQRPTKKPSATTRVVPRGERKIDRSKFREQERKESSAEQQQPGQQQEDEKGQTSEPAYDLADPMVQFMVCAVSEDERHRNEPHMDDLPQLIEAQKAKNAQKRQELTALEEEALQWRHLRDPSLVPPDTFVGQVKATLTKGAKKAKETFGDTVTQVVNDGASATARKIKASTVGWLGHLKKLQAGAVDHMRAKHSGKLNPTTSATSKTTKNQPESPPVEKPPLSTANYGAVPQLARSIELHYPVGKVFCVRDWDRMQQRRAVERLTEAGVDNGEAFVMEPRDQVGQCVDSLTRNEFVAQLRDSKLPNAQIAHLVHEFRNQARHNQANDQIAWIILPCLFLAVVACWAYRRWVPSAFIRRQYAETEAAALRFAGLDSLRDRLKSHRRKVKVQTGLSLFFLVVPVGVGTLGYKWQHEAFPWLTWILELLLGVHLSALITFFGIFCLVGVYLLKVGFWIMDTTHDEHSEKIEQQVSDTILLAGHVQDSRGQGGQNLNIGPVLAEFNAKKEMNPKLTALQYRAGAAGAAANIVDANTILANAANERATGGPPVAGGDQLTINVKSAVQAEIAKQQNQVDLAVGRVAGLYQDAAPPIGDIPPSLTISGSASTTTATTTTNTNSTSGSDPLSGLETTMRSEGE